jgi:hypothetical protein
MNAVNRIGGFSWFQLIIEDDGTDCHDARPDRKSLIAMGKMATVAM